MIQRFGEVIDQKVDNIDMKAIPEALGKTRFEGLGASDVRIEAGDLPIADGKDSGNPTPNLVRASLTAPAVMVEQQDPLTEVDDFLRLDSVGDPRGLTGPRS